MPHLAVEFSPTQPDRYEICIQEQLDDTRLIWFEEFAITRTESGNTVFTGSIVDQAALHGLLARIRDLNLTLISVNRITPRDKSKQ
jgi:hypothetical protein